MIKDALVPAGIIAALISMLVPLPGALLDLLLVGNLLIALILVISTLYISEPLKISSLPTMLLLATLYRLALNVSTTRLILSNQDTGQVIKAFGNAVIGGNVVVGLVVFLVISMIQFIVVAKGSERVAEVAARFTLDALPGRQMSIDADMRSGLIDFETARTKRQEVQTESRFYGALDGAMKFVKGDAIAGLVIIGINIVGGFTIGVAINGMDFAQALQHYTLLTVGDGLLAQIPSLLNSLAAGMVITKVSRGDGLSLARELSQQLGQFGSVNLLIAVVSLALALVPGLPATPFIGLGSVLALGVVFSSAARKSNDEVQAPIFQPKLPALIQLRLSSTFSKRLSAVELQSALEEFRIRIYSEFGLILSLPEMVVNTEAKESNKILLRGVPLLEFQTSESGSAKEYLKTQLWEAIYTNCAELVDDIATRRLLDHFDRSFPELVSAVVPGVISLTQLTGILRSLIAEDLPLTNFDLILQAVAESGPKASNERVILEDARIALKRLISSRLSSELGVIRGFTIDPVLDLALSSAERDKTFLNPELLENLAKELSSLDCEDKILFVSKGSRRILHEALKLRGISIVAIAFEELAPGFRFECIAELCRSVALRGDLLEQIAA